MKKHLNFLFVCAVTIVGTIGFYACSENDIDESANQFQGGEGEVPVQIVFNVSTNTGSQTRMSSSTVQADGTFRGIGEARFLAYQINDANGNITDGKHVTDWAKALRNYDLSRIVGAGDISASNSSRIIELSLPNGTNALMFYGRATKDESVTDSVESKNGYVRSAVFDDNSKGNTKFILMPRISQYTMDANGDFTSTETEEYKIWTQFRKLIVTVLNRITENGLHQETVTGTNGVRDLRARIWWPQNNVSNYKLEGPLVDLSKLTPAGVGITSINTFNSNIKECYGRTTNHTVSFNYLDADGNAQVAAFSYNGTTEILSTNVDNYKYNLGEVEWKYYGQHANDHTLSPLEEILGKAYNSFTVMKTDETGEISEIRAGTSIAIVRMIEDLWTVTNQVWTATPTSLPEAKAQALASRLHQRFTSYFTAVEDQNSGIVSGCRLRSPHDIVDTVHCYVDSLAYTTFASIKDMEDDKNINIFPSCSLLKMPAGSAQLICRNGVFAYNEQMAAYGMGMSTVSPLQYTWPAELLYYGNSPIRTSEKTLDPISYPHTVGDWSMESKWKEEDGWVSEHVAPLTRSVAMKYNINYGTALLATQLYYASNVLEDNNANLHPGEKNNEIRVNEAATYGLDSEIRSGGQKFELTGVVVGGQPLAVGWDFLQKTKTINENGEVVPYANNTMSYMIYDNEVPKAGGKWGMRIPDYTAESTYSTPNYTLVWDNWDESQKGASQSPVYVALEFRNCSGSDFWGSDNLVREGGIFYLIGKLDPNKVIIDGEEKTLSEEDLSAGINWPADGSYALPPYDANGNTIKERRVFIQGYKTVARFAITKESLQHAYLTVPDLRSANISLGLSVDIEWKTGLTFDVNL